MDMACFVSPEQLEQQFTQPTKSIEKNRAEQIEKIRFISSNPYPCKKPTAPSKTMLELKAKEIQRRLSDQGKYVHWQEVIYELLQLCPDCDSIADLGLRQVDHLEPVGELIRIQNRIDVLVISAEVKVPFLCLPDLEQIIISDYNHFNTKFNNKPTKISSFEEICVGPLIRNQIIRQVFKIPEEITSIKQMRPLKASELLKNLVNYLKDNDLWGSKLKQSEFEQFLCKKYKVDFVYLLGIKITNLGQVVGSLKTVQHFYSESLKEIRSNVDAEFKITFQNEKTWLFQKLEEKLDYYHKNYIKFDSIDVIANLMNIFHKLLDRDEYNYLSEFFDLLKDSCYMRDCFQLAICLGSHELEACINRIETNFQDENFFDKYKSLLKNLFILIIGTGPNRSIKKFLKRFLKERRLKIVEMPVKKNFDNESDSQDEETSEAVKEDKPRIDYDLKLRDFVQEKLEPNTILTYEHLARLEEVLYENLNYKFVDLLMRNQDLFLRNNLKIVLDEKKQENVNFNKKYLLEHIRQLKKSNLDNLEEILCNYYSIPKLENLECLIKEAETTNSDPGVVYANSVFNFETKISEEDLLEKLEDCPLLEDISEYLNWPGGDLKSYLINLNNQKIRFNQNEFRIDFLELQPGKYLKLTDQTDLEKLKYSIESGDPINSSGHLVSLICLKYKNLSQSPHSLLVSDLQSSFSNFLNKCQPDSDAFEQTYEYFFKAPAINRKFFSFIIEFIQRIPLKILKDLLFSFILEPLVELNSDHLIKEKIFNTLCLNTILGGSSLIDTKIQYFIKLGKFCSINEWSLENFKSTLEFLARLPKFSPKIEKSKQIIPQIVQIQQEKVKIEEKMEIIQMELSNSSGQFEHIQEIRRKYGIGLDLNEQTKSVTDSLKGVIGRSLESLSHELYNKDMHFVLELIQNADDNSYQTNLEPSLVFLIQKEKIILFNNELGFGQKNINAICDVKASTKGKHQRGYIGRKGIGFKSVFTVTDQPEIHSNGYHIKFDLSNGDIGYILPNWISDLETLSEIDQFKNLTLEKLDSTLVGDLSTCIKLPLKNDSKTSLLINNFNDIKPYLLLFLNRLRNLVILNDSTELIFHRQDLDENLIEIKSNKSETNQWFVVRECLKVPDNLKPSEDVESTDLCIAFPMDELKTSKNLPKMDVFAYLPLRSFGFKFIIQADFVVPASRQDINQDNPWNQWLAKQIPNLFLNTLGYFKKHKCFQSEINALKAFLRFIPLEEEVIGFFQHIPKQINDLLRNQEFLPAVDVDGRIVLKKPFECVIVKNENLIRQVLTSDLLKSHLGKYYLHESLLEKTEINQKILLNLGVHCLDMNDILEIVKTAFSNQINLKEFKCLAQWLAVLQHCLSGSYSMQQEDKFLKQLKQLQIIPIKTFDYSTASFKQEVVSLEKVNVFFPFKETSPIEKDLNLLDTDRLLCLDQLKNAQINTLLKNLGVKSITPCEIIENHILKVFSDKELLNSKPEEVLIFYTSYLNQHINSVNISKLKEVLLIKTNKGFKGLYEDIYLSPQYGNRHDLALKMPRFNWTVVDSVYLKSECKNWRKFFLDLGLKDTFYPKIVQTKIQYLQDSIYKECKLDNKIKKDEFYIFSDFECDVFNFYLEILTQIETPTAELIQELNYLYKILEENWENFNCKSVSVSISSEQDTKFNFKPKILNETICESQFYKKLKQSKWFCAEVGLNNQIKLLEPCNIFAKEQVFLRTYGQTVAYALCLNRTQFTQDLNFKFEFNLIEFLSEFCKWFQEEKRFHASLTQMRNIYLLLGNNLNSFEPRQEVLDLVQKSFLFVPDDFDGDFDKIRSGYFKSTDQVFWCDPSGLFLKYKSTNISNLPILLEEFYYFNSNKGDQLKQIFLKDFQIQLTPNLEHYINLLSHISLLSITNKTPYSYQQTICDVYTIYQILIEKCEELSDLEALSFKTKTSPIVKSHLLDLLKDKPIIPCFRNKWLKLSECPVLVEGSLDLAEKFIDKLNFVVINPVDSEDFSELCKADTISPNISYFYFGLLGLNSFTNVLILDLENITINLREAPQVQNTCRRILPLIQSFLFYKKEFQEIYQELSSVNIQEKLENTRFYSVKELESTYRFKHHQSIYAVVSNKTCMDTNGNIWKYFVRYDVLDNLKEIIRGFLKIFKLNDSSEKELLKFLLLMLQFEDSKLTAEDKNEIEKDYGLKFDLPSEILKWNVKEGVFVKQISKISELEEGEVEEKKFKTNSDGQSKRLQLLAYDKLSRDQLNLPGLDTKTQEFNVSHKSMENMNRNLSNLSDNMNLNFRVENLRKNSEIKHEEVELKFSDGILQELNSIRLSVPGEKSDRSKDFISKIGRWGEIWVNEMLKKSFKEGIRNNQIKVEWVNEVAETGLPYDFRVMDLTNNTALRFIEVKSTIKSDQEIVPVSFQELLFAQQNADKLDLYRLYNVACEDPNNVRIKVIRNIPELLHTHGINLFILV